MADVVIKIKKTNGGYYEVSNYDALNSCSVLTESNSDASTVYYEPLSNMVSVEISDIDGKIAKMIQGGEIDGASTEFELFINGKKIQRFVSTDSQYDNNNFTLSANATDDISTWTDREFNPTIYTQKSLTDSIPALALFAQIQESVEESILFNEKTLPMDNISQIGTADYLNLIYINNVNLMEKQSLHNMVNDLCDATQTAINQHLDGRTVCSPMRPIYPMSKDDIVKITSKNIFEDTGTQVIVKNKYKKVEIPVNHVDRKEIEISALGTEFKSLEYLQSKSFYESREYFNTLDMRLAEDISLVKSFTDSLGYEWGIYKKKITFDKFTRLNTKPIMVYKFFGYEESEEDVEHIILDNNVFNFDSIDAFISDVDKITGDDASVKFYCGFYQSDIYNSFVNNTELLIAIQSKQGLDIFEGLNYKNPFKFWLTSGSSNMLKYETIEYEYQTRQILKSGISDADIKPYEIICLSQNPLLTDTSMIYPKGRGGDGVLLYDHIAQAILRDYRNGVKVREITICPDNFYAHNNPNRLIKNFEEGDLINIGDIISVDNEDVMWKVTGARVSYDGELLQTLELQQAFASSSIGSSSGYGIVDENGVVVYDWIDLEADGKVVVTEGKLEYFDNSLQGNLKMPHNITSIGAKAFSGSKLTKIKLPESLRIIETSAFEYCRNATEIYIPSSVYKIGVSAFYHCTSLTSLNLGVNVTEIPNTMCAGCYNLKTLNIEGNVTRIGNGAFDGCRSLVFDIPNTVTQISGYAFYECKSLETITIPSGVTYIPEWCFGSCTKLASITLHNNITEIDSYAFEGTAITTITLPSNLTYISSGMFANSKLSSISIPSSVDWIGEQAFENCTNLTSISIPDTVINGIGQWAFGGCSNLSSVRLPSNIKVIEWSTFKYCSKLKTITIPSSVQNINGESFYASGLTSISIPSSVEYIEMNAFGECWDLATATISSKGGAWSWKIAPNGGAFTVTPSLSNTSTNAEMLRDTYANAVWSQRNYW